MNKSNTKEYFVKSVEVKGHRCSHCGLLSFSSEENSCSGCGNSFDSSDEMQYGKKGIIYNDEKKIAILTKFELWECDSCGSINANKPKGYDNSIEIDCRGCGNNFDINNWKKPFWQFEELTFSDENDYDLEFKNAYFDAFNIAKKNNDLEEFYAEYKKLHKKLEEERIFDRDDEVKNLYDYLLDYIKTNSFDKKNLEVENTKAKLEDIIGGKINFNNTKKIGLSSLVFLGMYLGITSEMQNIKIDNHSWEIITPKDAFKYKQFEIFNRYGSNDYKIYIERRKDKNLKLQNLGYGTMGNGTYHTENDGPKVLKDIPGTCYWTYKYETRQIDDSSKPIKETKTKKECHTIYKNITKTKTECRKINKGDKREEICRNVSFIKKVSDGEQCENISRNVIVGYKQKTVTDKIQDERICQKEWYQPTKQVENEEQTIIYKAKQWQSAGNHISSGLGLEPHIKYSSIIDEKIYENKSKTNYFLNYTIYSENGIKKDKVNLNNEYDWKSIKDGKECRVKVYSILGISLNTDNNSILEKCK